MYSVYCRLIITLYCLQLQSFMYLSGILATHLPKIMAECKTYKEKVIELFTPTGDKDISLNHLYKNIIVNPKALFNLVESNFLLQKKTENIALYYQLKAEVLSFIYFLMTDFPLNAILIYVDPFLVIANNKRINFITYLIKDVRQAFRWQMNSSSQQQKQTFKKYHEISMAIFYSFCSNCSLKTSQLKLISNSLTDFYYEERLYTNLIAHNFKLFSAGLKGTEIPHFISFIDNCKDDSISLEIHKGIWPFSKGFTSIIWINPHKCSNFELLKLKSGLGQQISVKIQGVRLAIATINLQGKQLEDIIEIKALSDQQDIMIGIELQPSRGLFNNSFQLNIKINEDQYFNISSKIPNFQNCQIYGSCCFLNNFIGKFYGTIVTSTPILNKWDQLAGLTKSGLYNQTIVKEFLDKKLIDKDQIVGIFNPQRFCQGKLINYINNNHFGYCNGRMFEPSYHSYGSKLIDIYLPFLYFTSIIKGKNEETYELFDNACKTILQIITRQNYETESVLLLLYFLETNQYKITQQTWNILYNHYKERHNFYLNFVIKFIDIQSLVRNGIEADEELQPFSDPVERLIFMFHLETKWKQIWNQLQGFEGWWSPSFFEPQNNKSFNHQDFVYRSDKENRVQWSVLNLVTKDYCKSFVQPIFILPQYAVCDRYQKQYNKKQCFSFNFQLNLNQHPKNTKIVFNKVSNSKFDKFKSKFLGKRQPKLQIHPKKKGQQVQIKEFQSDCIFIDILTVIQGNISIKKQGFIIFHSSHKGKDYDHMCAKAFKNQTFYYFNIPFPDVKEIYKKRFNASNNAIYIKTQDGKQMMFHFHLKNVDPFLNILQNFVKVKKDAFSNYVNSNQPLRWIDKYMSNYEYLQWLNEIAGRNYNDITQYPVLPWVFVADQQNIPEQTSLSTHRDLTKNIGSHGDQARIKQFLEKYQNVNEEQLFSEYHFGTHYSSSAIIFNFLIRIRPYSVGALALQSGKFDCADRIFHSYFGSWKNATTSTTDIRELIPQIYTLPQMFINKNNYYYGVTQDKEEVDNAALPRWANGNPYYFVSELRKQLEKRYVSQNINHWIDLIYGYKQRGKDAVQHMNIFYPLTDENCIDLDQVTQKNERISFQTQIAHFGQNPSQIIGNNPHPARKAIKGQWQDKLVADDGSRLLIQSCFLNNEESEQQSLLFNSVFEGKNAVLGVKFINDTSFIVMRRTQYYLFQILHKKIDFLSKEQYVELQPEQIEQTSFNFKQISSFTPIAAINQEVVIVGGYYIGFCNVIFLKEPKYNKNFQFHTNTVTALNYDSTFQTLFVGDVCGYLNAYRVNLFPKHIQFQFIKSIKAHDSKINDITINTNANIVCTCSEDGFANIYNLYSHKILRTFHHPSHLPIHFAHITTNPLYAIAFYSKENSTVYTYSINGQFLDSIIQKTGFIYNMSILKSTDSTECLVYMNCQKELFIWELPFLRLKRKVKIRKDQNKISCLEACSNGKVIITGSEDGSLQIIANPQSY